MFKSVLSAPAKLLLVGLALLLTGCTETTPISNYAESAAAHMGTKLSTDALPLPEQPRRTPWLTKDDSKSKVSLFEPMQLRACGVPTVVYQYSGPLGKAATPSVQLFHFAELAFRMQSCDVERLEEKGNKLRTSWLTDNEDKMPSYFSRQLILTDELWFNLGGNRGSENVYNTVDAVEAMDGLIRLRQQLLELEVAPISFQQEFEGLLRQLDQTGLPAGLHRRMIQTADALNGLAEQLENANPISCDALKRIEDEALAADVATELASLLITDRELMSRLTLLLAEMPNEIKNHEYVSYFVGREPGSLRHAFTESVNRHRSALGQAHLRCQ